MCGIAGIFAYREFAPPVDRDELLNIREQMARRGPDGSGIWVSQGGQIGLAHRRLAIIDLSDAGAQPMATEDGQLRITFNGEIYNYRELRKELEANGHRFHTNSDTEVLLYLYSDRGSEMVHALRGMYAFAIWDERNKTLFLGRDPFGIKPLYYADDGATIRFASQVKALLKSNHVDTTPEPAGHVGFFLWGSVPEPYTLYREIRALPAGAYLKCTFSGLAGPTRFFSVATELLKGEQAAAMIKSESAVEMLREALRDSVRHHLIADVPVGIFLSSGLDSTLVAGLAVEVGASRLNALTLGFREYQGTEMDEVPLAELTASYYGIPHETRWIDESEFHADLDKMLAAMDQPTTNGVNTYLVSKAAAARGMKVALSGLGGDELFGGYPSFRHVPRIAALFPGSRRVPAVGKAFRRMTAGTLGRFTSPKWAGLLEYGGSYSGAYLLRRALYMPWELEGILDPAMAKVGLEELQPLMQLEQTASGLHGARQRVAALEIEWYMRNQLLRDADWAGMAHSLEIRVPLVDVELFRRVAPLLAAVNPPTKFDAAQALIKPLPESVINRPKTGFATPIQRWISHGAGNTLRTRGLRGWASRVLPPTPRKFRALALVTDAFGGKGGIAKFNRDFLSALCRMSECDGVVAVPRLILAPIEPLPIKLTFLTEAAAGKLLFVWTVLRVVLQNRFDLVVAGHINLLPLASIISRCTRARLLLIIHGIDAWTRHSNFLVRKSISSVSTLAAVSQLTLDRFGSWAAVEPEKCHILPNCIEMTRYGPGPKSQPLAERLGILGKPVIMTAGRLSHRERYKGFDAIINVLPELIKQVPDLVYMICGEGDDRDRLEAKAEALGMGRHVIFSGFVPEEEKADYFRLADAYVMPSRGEGFGIVFLEAMACGVPVLGSKTDGGREALMSGELGLLVDPENQQEIVKGILETLKQPHEVPLKLQYYSSQNFERRVADLIRQVVQSRA